MTDAKRPRRYWRIAAALFIVIAKLAQFATTGPTENTQDASSAYHGGAYLGDALMLALVIWLLYTGFGLGKGRTPKG
jgi:Mn2+/Fe2+ NRAMP family transporter